MVHCEQHEIMYRSRGVLNVIPYLTEILSFGIGASNIIVTKPKNSDIPEWRKVERKMYTIEIYGVH